MRTIAAEIVRHLPVAGEARRLFHGRGGCFPGYEDLVIDYFPPVTLVILYQPRSQVWLEHLTRLLEELLPDPAPAVLLQERYHANAPSRLLHGALPDCPEALEAGLSFRLRLGTTQNIGFFPDMAAGRKAVRERAADKSVLNLFAYSCSFSVAALAGGAARVVNVDMNRGALELGRLNHQINGIDLRRASFLAVEYFRSLGKLRRLGPFDLVICDPPGSQGESFSAERHWPKLVRSLPGLIKPGGEVLACLSSPHFGPDFLDSLFAASIPGAVRLERFDAGGDFPEARPQYGVKLHLYLLD
jgi:23S rRNA (cytosine1962-C5)-methyltransferase